MQTLPTSTQRVDGKIINNNLLLFYVLYVCSPTEVGLVLKQVMFKKKTFFEFLQFVFAD